MFRKRKKVSGLRKKRTTAEEDNDEEDKEASRELRENLKRAKQEHGGGGKVPSGATTGKDDVSDQQKEKGSLMHTFVDSGKTISQKELATATTQHHPKSMEEISKSQSLKDPKRNKFLAGPIRAPTNIRTTCRFDYQPDICKDYKDTGFCGFGDTCIYLHDRGDTMNGWQLDKAWDDKLKSKKKRMEEELDRLLDNGGVDNKGANEAGGEALNDDDGLPFACFLSRKAFEDPIVTICSHYFSQGSLQEHFQRQSEGEGGGASKDQSCPICNRNTHGVMNQPTKLIAKKRKLLGRKATWQEYMDSRGGRETSKETNE